MDYDKELGRRLKGIDVYGLTTVTLVGVQLLDLRVTDVEEELQTLRKRLESSAAPQTSQDVGHKVDAEAVQKLEASLKGRVDKLLSQHQKVVVEIERDAKSTAEAMVRKAEAEMRTAAEMQPILQQIERQVRGGSTIRVQSHSLTRTLNQNREMEALRKEREAMARKEAAERERQQHEAAERARAEQKRADAAQAEIRDMAKAAVQAAVQAALAEQVEELRVLRQQLTEERETRKSAKAQAAAPEAPRCSVEGGVCSVHKSHLRGFSIPGDGRQFKFCPTSGQLMAK